MLKGRKEAPKGGQLNEHPASKDQYLEVPKIDMKTPKWGSVQVEIRKGRKRQRMGKAY